MLTVSPILADLEGFTRQVVSTEQSSHGFLHIIIVLYLVIAAITAIFMIMYALSRADLVVAEILGEGSLWLLFVVALAWPIWLIVWLIVRSEGGQTKSAAPAAAAIGKSPAAPCGFPAAARVTEPGCCAECNRKLDKNHPGYAWRNITVCRECRQSLAVLDA
jgi:hypothetical protein